MIIVLGFTLAGYMYPILNNWSIVYGPFIKKQPQLLLHAINTQHNSIKRISEPIPHTRTEQTKETYEEHFLPT